MKARACITSSGGVLVVATALFLSACGSDLDLPNDQVFASEHFRYHVRSTETAVCGDLLGRLESHLSLMQSMLGFTWVEGRVIDYYMFHDSRDFLKHAPCQGAMRCASGNDAYSILEFDEHELVHAYLKPIGQPPVVIEEGAAMALACDSTIPETLTLSLEDALQVTTALDDKRVYDTGGRFVRYLLDRYGGEAFLRVYASLHRDAKLAALDETLRTTYGAGVDELWTAMLATHATCPPPFACSRPALPIDGAVVKVAPICGVNTDYRTFVLASESNVAITGPVNTGIRSCESGSFLPQLATSYAMGTSQVGLFELDAGRYYLRFDPRYDAAVSVLATEQAWAGSDCEALVPYGVGADEYPAFSVTLPEKPTVWILRMRFEGPHLMVLSHPHSVDESIQVKICPACDFDSPACQSGDLARDDISVLWDGDYFLRFESILVTTTGRIDIVGR